MILPWLGNYTTDHRSPLASAGAAGIVTGRGGRHLGNAPVGDRTIQDLRIEESNLNVTTLADRFDTRAYLSPHSDIVALLVFDHQMRMMNLLTRLGMGGQNRGARGTSQRDGGESHGERTSSTTCCSWTKRPSKASRAHRGLPSVWRPGTAGQQGPFAARPRIAAQTASLSVQLHDLFGCVRGAAGRDRKMQCTQRLWQVLSGSDPSPRYARLSPTDRQAIIEILRENEERSAERLHRRAFLSCSALSRADLPGRQRKGRCSVG